MTSNLVAESLSSQDFTGRANVK
uniref:Uncharacterized protein n=1 Tax=Rhizophora mucronata TaxID=61149 RepID=A0A2P2NXA0_RHIMU